MQKINILNTEFKLTLILIFVLLLLKIFFIKDVFTILKTSLYDVILFLFIYFLFNIYNFFFTKVLFYFFSIINFFIFSFYYIYFYSVYQRIISFSDLSKDLFIFLFKNIISIKYILIIAFTLIIVIYLAIFLFKKKKLLVSKKIYIYGIIGTIFLFLILSFTNFSYNPYKDMIFQFNKKAISLNFEKVIDENIFITDKSIKEYTFENIKYRKIIIFIGEEWMFSDFISEKEKLTNNFFENIKSNSHNYTNHFTTNQDSRTSIFSILSSHFIPFEAYVDNKTYDKYYSIISSKNNLVDFFNYNNYSTQFLVSALEIPDLTYPYNWDKVNTLSKEKYNSKDYFCDNSFTFETSCEDLSVIDDFKKIVLENENLFLFQEFIYGHSYGHILKNKKTRTEYYNNYFLEVYSFLEENNLLDETLIIITSDHGSRATKDMMSFESYKVPLLFISKYLNYSQINNLSSHLDFKDLLFNYVLENNNQEINNQSIMFIGSTQSNFIGFVDKNNTFGIINTSLDKLINYSDNDNIKNISNKYYTYYQKIIDDYE